MNLKTGELVDGKVTRIEKFGAFLDLGNGNRGMIHISELSNRYVHEVTDVLELGQEIKAKILDVTPDGKISLSLKRIEQDTNSQNGENNNSDFARGKYNRDSGSYKRGNRSGNGGSQRQKRPMDFEEMMSKFKQSSDEKMSDVRKSFNSKRAGNIKRAGSGGSQKI